jgi:hypothetical protein
MLAGRAMHDAWYVTNDGRLIRSVPDWDDPGPCRRSPMARAAIAASRRTCADAARTVASARRVFAKVARTLEQVRRSRASTALSAPCVLLDAQPRN